MHVVGSEGNYSAVNDATVRMITVHGDSFFVESDCAGRSMGLDLGKMVPSQHPEASSDVGIHMMLGWKHCLHTHPEDVIIHNASLDRMMAPTQRWCPEWRVATEEDGKLKMLTKPNKSLVVLVYQHSLYVGGDTLEETLALHDQVVKSCRIRNQTL